MYMLSALEQELIDAAMGEDDLDPERIRSITEFVDEDSGWTLLHWAAIMQNAKLAQRLLDLGANASATSLSDLSTPLHTLFWNGKGPSARATLKVFLEHERTSGPDLLLAPDKDGDTPLHCAALNGDTGMLEEILPRIPDVDIPNSRRKTALHLAARNGHLEAVGLLLKRGARKELRGSRGWLPFHYAACSDNTSVLELLQPKCIDDKTHDKKGFTALHIASMWEQVDAVKWLLDHKASVDVMASEDNITPLQVATSTVSFNNSVIETLIDGGANPLQPDKDRCWPLTLAHKNSSVDAAKTMVKTIKLRGQDRIEDSLRAVDCLGATLLHYFAAYGSMEELTWILGLMQSKKDDDGVVREDKPSTGYEISRNAMGGNPVNIKDLHGRTPIHWAAARGNKDAVSVLAERKAALNAESEEQFYKTPLSLALVRAEMEFAEELVKYQPKNSDWLSGIRYWMRGYFEDEENDLSGELAKLRDVIQQHTKSVVIGDDDDQSIIISEIPVLYLALHARREDIARFIQQHSKGVDDDPVNEKGKHTGCSPLHWATQLRQQKIVAQLCRGKIFAPELNANAEDNHGRTALEYAKSLGLEDIEKELMQRSDVRSHVDVMYKDRQVYVDAANAILVGAALIAGVAFAAWLQPPLGYAQYYDQPEAYAAVRQSMGVRLFWGFNSLSFSFAIASMIAGLIAVVPIPGVYIGKTVQHLRLVLPIASSFLGLSLMLVLAAFGAAGFAVLPPLFKYQANMMATAIIGGIPCIILLTWFAFRVGPCIILLTWFARRLWCPHEELTN